MSASFTVDDFRNKFPEFTDDELYPDEMINFWAGLGIKMMNEERWGELLDDCLKLFVAHQVALSGQNNATGATPGTSGLIASESAGPLSYSKDTHSATELDGGHWNLTTYGSQFLRIARMVGAGGYQVW